MRMLRSSPVVWKRPRRNAAHPSRPFFEGIQSFRCVRRRTMTIAGAQFGVGVTTSPARSEMAPRWTARLPLLSPESPTRSLLPPYLPHLRCVEQLAWLCPGAVRLRRVRQWHHDISRRACHLGQVLSIHGKSATLGTPHVCAIILSSAWVRTSLTPLQETRPPIRSAS